MLKTEGIKKTFAAAGKKIEALGGVSLEVKKGELVAVNGPSGCGKTTLLLVAGGLLFPDEGRVMLGGVDLYGVSPEQRAKERAAGIGFVFQQFYLIPYLNVLENVLVPAVKRGSREKRAFELLERFNLKERIGHKPSELSTGERQRTALVRALINGPGFLFADEPTGNLDDANAKEVMDYISGFASEGGGVLLVSHDMRTSVHADRTYSMERGNLRACEQDKRRNPA